MAVLKSYKPTLENVWHLGAEMFKRRAIINVLPLAGSYNVGFFIYTI